MIFEAEGYLMVLESVEMQLNHPCCWVLGIDLYFDKPSHADIRMEVIQPKSGTIIAPKFQASGSVGQRKRCDPVGQGGPLLRSNRWPYDHIGKPRAMQVDGQTGLGIQKAVGGQDCHRCGCRNDKCKFCGEYHSLLNIMPDSSHAD